MSWFKHGVQYDAKCNAVLADGTKAKPKMTVFSFEDTMTDAIKLAIDELTKYGYYDLTIDKITRIK